jgi:hypothetical protein
MTFKNEKTGQIRKVPQGFSWTTLFFGYFPALFRSDFKMAFVQVLLVLPTFGISCLVFPFIYNGIYERELREEGFLPI